MVDQNQDSIVDFTTVTRPARVLVALCAALLAAPRGLSAQVVVRVHTYGIAVPAAEVSTRDVQGRLRSDRTGGIGNIRIDLERPSSASPFVLAPRDTVMRSPALARPLPTRFQPEIDAFRRADSVSPPPSDGIEFVGSSIIRLWTTLGAQMAPLPAYNRGFGGSQTSDVLYYMDRIVVPYRPRFVVYYCGSNDVSAGESADSIVARVQEFHQRLARALPQTRMFFLSVLHAPEKRAKWAIVDSVNARMQRYAATAKNVEYVDVNPSLLDTRGEVRGALYLPDSLHYVPGAYDLFTGVVKPVLVRAWSATP